MCDVRREIRDTFTHRYLYIGEAKQNTNTCMQSQGQWRTQKVSEGGPKFRHNRVTLQINLGSAEGTTVIGWSGGMQWKHFAKLHLKFSCILEASFSIMLLRDLLEE